MGVKVGDLGALIPHFKAYILVTKLKPNKEEMKILPTGRRFSMGAVEELEDTTGEKMPEEV